MYIISKYFSPRNNMTYNNMLRIPWPESLKKMETKMDTKIKKRKFPFLERITRTASFENLI